MLPLLDPSKLSLGRSLAPDAGEWERGMGGLWLKKAAPPTLTLKYDFGSLYSSFLPSSYYYSSIGSLTAGQEAAPTPDLPLERRDMPVIGFRAWNLDETFDLGVGKTWSLKSTNMSFAWKRDANAAVCSTTNHVAPDQRCGCGLYVIASLKELDGHINMAKRTIVGAVMGWGRVVQHGTEGWRAQYAKILALLDCKYSEKQAKNTEIAAAAYGLEIKTRPQLDALVREYGDPLP